MRFYRNAAGTHSPRVSRRLADQDRQGRVNEIREGALVRAALGQGARHRRLPDGAHEIATRMGTYTAATLDEAIARARG